MHDPMDYKYGREAHPRVRQRQIEALQKTVPTHAYLGGASEGRRSAVGPHRRGDASRRCRSWGFQIQTLSVAGGLRDLGLKPYQDMTEPTSMYIEIRGGSEEKSMGEREAVSGGAPGPGSPGLSRSVPSMSDRAAALPNSPPLRRLCGPLDYISRGHRSI